MTPARDHHVLRQGFIATFVSMIVVAPVLWMLLDREPPYTFQSADISPSDVPQGAEIHITFRVKQTRAPCGPGLVYRELKESSGKLHVYDPVMRAAPPDIVNNQFTRISKLPDNIGSGPTMYRGMACYTCNILQNWLRWPVCVSTPNVTFNVTAKDRPQ